LQVRFCDQPIDTKFDTRTHGYPLSGFGWLRV